MRWKLLVLVSFVAAMLALGLWSAITIAVFGSARVLAQNDWFRSPVGVDYGESVPSQRAAYDEVLIEEASSAGAEFVDMRPLYAEQADQNQWVEDGLHPTPDAYAAWAEKLSEAVPAPCKS